jgi:regulator of sigma E protease
VLTLLATIVVLSVLILVHELGHFFAAKSVDIEVPRFSLGLGPKVAGFRIGETEYVLSALPLGGYVKMAGMEENEALEGGPAAAPRAPSSRDFDAKPLWARAWVVTAGVLMNLLFAFLVYTGLGLAYGERLNPVTRMIVPEPAELPAGTGALAAVPAGAQVVAVDGHEITSWTEIEEAIQAAPAGPLAFRFADAPPVTIDLPASDSERFALLTAVQPLYPPVIGQILPGSPAATAGIQPGDRVVRAAGEPIASWQDMVKVIRARPEQPTPLEVERGGRAVTLELTPSAERVPNEPRPIGQIGVAPEIETVHRSLGVGGAIARGAELTWLDSKGIVRFLRNLVTGQESARSVGSILTIGQISGQTARMGLEVFLGFMALFSINLAILNLLPIPILDGGHLLFIVIEAVRGRPLSVEQRMRLSHVGLLIVIGLMVWAMTNDVLRVFGI